MSYDSMQFKNIVAWIFLSRMLEYIGNQNCIYHGELSQIESYCSEKHQNLLDETSLAVITEVTNKN
jgi:uncharacterized protein YqcC (DUF446 family)